MSASCACLHAANRSTWATLESCSELPPSIREIAMAGSNPLSARALRMFSVDMNSGLFLVEHACARTVSPQCKARSQREPTHGTAFVILRCTRLARMRHSLMRVVVLRSGEAVREVACLLPSACAPTDMLAAAPAAPARASPLRPPRHTASHMPAAELQCGVRAGDAGLPALLDAQQHAGGCPAFLNSPLASCTPLACGLPTHSFSAPRGAMRGGT